ncbi:hypothetical protein V1505DRAFT_416470 [Lipomyces doorenjongii]
MISNRLSVADQARQSHPIDPTEPFNLDWVRGKTIVITGGASGFGESIVGAVRTATDNNSHHYLHCDVTGWQSQVVQRAENLDLDDPPKPDMRVLDVNLVGVLYTTHLALFYLPRNPGSEPADPNKSTSKIEESPVTAFMKGVRVNMLCPYFVDTGILTLPGRMLLAGTNLAQLEDVIEAGSRLMADSRISERNLVVGPRLSLQYCRQEGNENCMEVSLWEVHTDDLEATDVFMRRVVGLMNAAQEMRGWILWTKDMAKVLFDMVNIPAVLPTWRREH